MPACEPSRAGSLFFKSLGTIRVIEQSDTLVFGLLHAGGADQRPIAYIRFIILMCIGCQRQPVVAIPHEAARSRERASFFCRPQSAPRRPYRGRILVQELYLGLALTQSAVAV